MDVPPVLYNLVFGESVINDATAIVLFRTLEEFYETTLSWGTVPLIFWRFFIIATGSIFVGEQQLYMLQQIMLEAYAVSRLVVAWQMSPCRTVSMSGIQCIDSYMRAARAYHSLAVTCPLQILTDVGIECYRCESFSSA